MLVNPNNKEQLKKATEHFNKLVSSGSSFELKKVVKTRSQAQNRALHLYFRLISYHLNELGMEFQYQGIKGTDISLMYTENLVKEFIWRPIQVALFDVKSTTKIDTTQINRIVEVLSKFFAERGIEIVFPSIDTLINEYYGTKMV